MSVESFPVEEQENPFDLFPDAMHDPVYGLTYVGHLEKEVEFCGHTFVLKTLRPSEKAAVALAVQPLRGSLAEPEAWANATVAMALVAIDEVSDFCPPVNSNINDFARARYNWATNPEKGWYQPTFDFLYEVYLGMELEVTEAIKAAQNLSTRSLPPSPPSADSLTDKGISLVETISATQPSTSSNSS